ncbi:MAG TPA: hypothetical protein GX708_23330 [Gallicola sp.]|nr:hypothetical protein [Gallicola sp.]
MQIDTKKQDKMERFQECKHGILDTDFSMHANDYYTVGSEFIILPDNNGVIRTREQMVIDCNDGEIAKVLRWIEPYFEIGGSNKIKYKCMILKVGDDKRIAYTTFDRLGYKLKEKNYDRRSFKRITKKFRKC